MFESYRYFDHEADIGIEAYGKTPEKAFENAACAMFAIMVHPATVLPERRIHVEFDEPDRELALVEWLNRLLAQARLAGIALASFEVKREGDHYIGEAWGMPWKPNVERGTEVKGATLTELSVTHERRRWRVRCVVDV